VQVRGALTTAKGGDRLDQLEISLREAITAGKRQSLPLMFIDGSETRPLSTADLGLAPVTVAL
jgi:hypothetical protein